MRCRYYVNRIWYRLDLGGFSQADGKQEVLVHWTWAGRALLAVIMVLNRLRLRRLAVGLAAVALGWR